jgi:hypothetical protein
METIKCYHLLTLEQASGVKRLVLVNRLNVSACGVCDGRVPVDESLAVGQDVSCVGPNNPLCPDPLSATIVSEA